MASVDGPTADGPRSTHDLDPDLDALLERQRRQIEQLRAATGNTVPSSPGVGPAGIRGAEQLGRVLAGLQPPPPASVAGPDTPASSPEGIAVGEVARPAQRHGIASSN